MMMTHGIGLDKAPRLEFISGGRDEVKESAVGASAVA